MHSVAVGGLTMSWRIACSIRICSSSPASKVWDPRMLMFRCDLHPSQIFTVTASSFTHGSEEGWCESVKAEQSSAFQLSEGPNLKDARNPGWLARTPREASLHSGYRRYRYVTWLTCAKKGLWCDDMWCRCAHPEVRNAHVMLAPGE